MNKQILYTFLFLILLTSVIAVDFTPQGNINLKNTYNIFNVVNLNGTGNISMMINASWIQNAPWSLATSLSSETSAREGNDTILSNKITSIGNWSNDKSSYYNTTQTDSLFSSLPNLTLSQISNNIGNWSADKASYTLLSYSQSLGNWSSDKSSYTTLSYTQSLGNFSSWDKDYADLIYKPSHLSNFTNDLNLSVYNDTSLINAVNTTSNIMGLGFYNSSFLDPYLINGGNRIYWFTNTTYSSSNRLMSLTIPTNSLTTLTTSLNSLSIGDKISLGTFITPATTTSTVFAAGIRYAYLSSYISSSGKNVNLQVIVSRCVNYNTSTDVCDGGLVGFAQSTTSICSSTSRDIHILTYFVNSTYILNSTDRFILNITAEKLVMGNNDVILEVDDGAFSRIEVPSPVGVTDISSKLDITDQRYNDTALALSLGNWSNDKSRYYNTTQVDSIVVSVNNLSLSQIVLSIGNWSNDKPNYALQSNVDSRGNWTEDKVSYALITYVNSIGNFSAWNKAYSDLIYKPTHLSNFTDNLGNRGYTSLSNFTNDIDLINSTYGNNTYLKLSDQRFNETGLISSMPNLSLSQISTNLGNWSADKASYATITSVNNNYTDLNNKITSIGNWSSDKSNYRNSTTDDSQDLALVNSVGNWSSDKSNYYNTSVFTTQVMSSYASVQRDPQGFPYTTNTENNLYSRLSYNEATRSFNITPVGSSYYYYIAGNLVNVTTNKNITISNTAGLHIIYFNPSGNLVETSVLTEDVLCNNVIVGIVSLGTPLNRLSVEDERHSHYMECVTHLEFHETIGTHYESGLALTNVTVGGSAASNQSAQLGVTAGQISDEDYHHDISAKNNPATMRTYYSLGTAGNWSFKEDSFPVCYQGTCGITAGQRLNANTGLTSWTQCGNGQILLTHIFATNNINDSHRIFAVTGSTCYATSTLATTSASNEVVTILSTGAFNAEVMPLYSLLLTTTTAATNTPKAVWTAPSTGGSFIDYRYSNINGVSGVSGAGTVTLVGTDSTLDVDGVPGGSITGAGTLSIDNTYIQTFNDTTAINNEILARQSTGNWTADKSSYALITYVQSIGNWTLDKSSYSTTAEANLLYAPIAEPIASSLGNFSLNGVPYSGGTNNITPQTTNVYNIGSTTLKYKNVYVAGDVNTARIVNSGDIVSSSDILMAAGKKVQRNGGPNDYLLFGTTGISLSGNSNRFYLDTGWANFSSNINIDTYNITGSNHSAVGTNSSCTIIYGATSTLEVC